LEVRLAEVRLVEVRLAEVRLNKRLFRPPDVPDVDALPEEFEVLWIRIVRPYLTSRRHHGLMARWVAMASSRWPHATYSARVARAHDVDQTGPKETGDEQPDRQSVDHATPSATV
jgi:hypothetical protein